MYDRLCSGADITTRRATRIVQWFSDHWPTDLEWPADIPRPDPAPDSPACATVASSGIPTKAALDKQVKQTMRPWLVGVAQLRRAIPGTPPPFVEMQAIQSRALAQASVLNARGQIVSPLALCTALDLPLATYYHIASKYKDKPGRDVPLPPRPGTQGREMLDALVATGDVRFGGRRDKVAAISARMRRATG